MDTMEPKERTIPDLLYRVAVGALIFFVALLVGISAAHAMELVPQAGITKSADGSGTKRIVLPLAVALVAVCAGAMIWRRMRASAA